VQKFYLQLNYKFTKELFLDESFCPPVKLVLPPVKTKTMRFNSWLIASNIYQNSFQVAFYSLINNIEFVFSKEFNIWFRNNRLLKRILIYSQGVKMSLCYKGLFYLGACKMCKMSYNNQSKIPILEVSSTQANFLWKMDLNFCAMSPIVSLFCKQTFVHVQHDYQW